ncbi:ATP-binding cassette domain-containing protein [Fructobacillus sp. M2-14]|uniref:ATP-binding cassette domain-containing protein n=1 Tax=Fructobacillus broussonetiae TaxID=2713173 RepID=A0ABS5QYC7_9LACO|nr:ABC transporter ATP-binding protein [Fructobacillus broussonetiae]MBS9338111.1 ATP-binding cassette domain-containing protein [Fructobacillus broussonetiae]
MALTAKNLSFSYRKKSPIFENVNLNIEKGSFTLMMGPSGCGKSTLFKCLAGLFPQYGGMVSGSVTVDGEPVAESAANERVKKVSMLFQNPKEQFVLETVEAEIAFALENLSLEPAEIENRIDKALAMVHISEFKHRFLGQLSGGEMQKVVLAEVLALGAEYLLLDEPFAAVDHDSRVELQELFLELSKAGYAVLVCDHDDAGYENRITDFYRCSKGEVTSVESDNWPKDLGEEVFELAAKLPGTGLTLTASELALENDQRLLLFQKELEVNKGDLILITGENGSGKSTFLKAISKLQKYDGALHFNGKNLSDWKNKAYYQSVGLVFQSALDQFLTITVEEELAQVKRYAKNQRYWTEDRVDDALERLELTGLSKRSVYTLSGGQQKKLQVLLMLMTEKELLLFDEPFAGLDNDSFQKVIELIQESRAALEQTMLIVSHQIRPLMGVVNRRLHLQNRELNEEVHA